MLAHQNHREVIEALRPVLAKAGFRRRHSTWYRFSRESIQVLDLQPAGSRSSQKLHINIGVSFRHFHPPTHLRIFDCPAYGRLEHIIPDDTTYASVTDFSDKAFSQKERVAKFADYVQRFALPFLDNWRSKEAVKLFADSKRSAGFNIRNLDADKRA